jgi:hypothetical protein
MHDMLHLLESCHEQAPLPDGPDPTVEPKTRSRARLPKHRSARERIGSVCCGALHRMVVEGRGPVSGHRGWTQSRDEPSAISPSRACIPGHWATWHRSRGPRGPGRVPEAVSHITKGRGQRGPEAVGRVAQARLRPCSARRLLAVDGDRQRRSPRYDLGRRWSTAWAREERACCPLPVPIATNSVTASSTHLREVTRAAWEPKACLSFQ